MAYQTIFEANKTSMIGIWSYVNTVSPVFTPMVLFGLFIISMVATYMMQLRTRGFGDIIASFSVSSIFVAIVSVIMTFSEEQIINGPTTIICIALGIVGLGVLLATDSEN